MSAAPSTERALSRGERFGLLIVFPSVTCFASPKSAALSEALKELIMSFRSLHNERSDYLCVSGDLLSFLAITFSVSILFDCQVQISFQFLVTRSTPKLLRFYGDGGVVLQQCIGGSTRYA